MSTKRNKIVLLGMMCRHPVAGVIWQTLHYLEGFRRLGCDAYYVEAHGAHLSMFARGAEDDDAANAARFLATVMGRFDFAGKWALHAIYEGRVFGRSDAQLAELYRSADVIINLHGATVPRQELTATGRLIYIETDPVTPQIELYQGSKSTAEFLAAHAALFTFGENYGKPDCGVPVSDRFHFRPTRQPVVIDFWRGDSAGPARGNFTTIGNWEQTWRDVEFRGEIYHWSKHHEFLKFIKAPSLTGASFELALARCDDGSRALLETEGWRVRDALALSSDPDAYRDYVAGSRGEFTVAKDQNVRLRSGWFSDRSATYLAAGRPVITQETGFSNVLPTGQGLFAFSTMEDVMQAIDSVNSDYARHCRAAAEVARECFGHDRVLGRLLEQVGL
jgi:hypothetical protein